MADKEKKKLRPMKRDKRARYSIELCQEICEHVASGMNIADVLKLSDKYPSWSNFRAWKNNKPELHRMYILAIQDKAEMVDFEIDNVLMEMKKGELDFRIARVMIDTLKWKASKYYPKMFGDNKGIDLTSGGKEIKQEKITVRFVDYSDDGEKVEKKFEM